MMSKSFLKLKIILVLDITEYHNSLDHLVLTAFKYQNSNNFSSLTWILSKHIVGKKL